MTNSTSTINSSRLCSIDAARGFAMFWYLGGTSLFIGLACITGNVELIELMTRQMNHAPWHGLTFSDIFFPFFLFISGMTFPMSLSRKRQKGNSDSAVYLNILRRALIMVLLGFVYNGLLETLDFGNFRCYSVLARLGIAWAVAAVIYMNTKNRWVRTAWFFIPILLYWIIMACIPAPDFPDSMRFSMEGNIAGYIDRTLFPNHLYNLYYDPEGLLGYIPSVSTAFLGILTGDFISDSEHRFSKGRKALYLLAGATILIVIGLLWNTVFPVNKRLWSSSFVCLTGGISLLIYDVFFYLVEICNSRAVVMPLTVFGTNSIAAYLAYKMLDLTHTCDFLFGGIFSLFPENWRRFLDSLGPMLILWFIFFILYRKRVYLKI